ncbi:MAG: LamG-like jellyroll fold domain-containing protein [Bacteriovoracia bacterium]
MLRTYIRFLLIISWTLALAGCLNTNSVSWSTSGSSDSTTIDSSNPHFVWLENPGLQAAPLGDSPSLTIEARDGNGLPMPAVPVNFTISTPLTARFTSTGNMTYSSTTDAAGQITFQIDTTGLGVIGITATSPLLPPISTLGYCIPAGVRMWLNAGQNSLTLDPTGGVMFWSDVSGNSLDASQATSTSRPLYVPSAINGLPGILFDGSDDNLDIPGTTGSDFSAGISAFIVAKTIVPSTTQYLFDFTNSGSSRLALSIDYQNSLAFEWDLSGQISPVNSYLPGGFLLYESVLSSGSIKLFKNGVQTAGPGVCAPTVTSRSINKVGSTYAGSAPMNGIISEILIYNVSLSPTEQAAVEDYLRLRYNLW